MKDTIYNDLYVGDLILTVPCNKFINKSFEMYGLVVGENQIFISKQFTNENYTILNSKDYMLYKLDYSTNMYLKEIYSKLIKIYNKYSVDTLNAIQLMNNIKVGTIIETYDKKNKYLIYLGTGSIKYCFSGEIFEDSGYSYVTLASFLNTYHLQFKESDLNKYSELFDIDMVLNYAARNHRDVSSVFFALDNPKIIKEIKGHINIKNISIDRYYFNVKITANINSEGNI